MNRRPTSLAMASSCYVVGTPGEAHSKLLRTLRSIGLEITSHTAPSTRSSVDEAARAFIAGADVVVVWLGSGAAQPWAMYELGVAMALDRPVAILSDLDSPVPPLPDLFVQRVDPGDDQGVATALDAVLRTPTGTSDNLDLERGPVAAVDDRTVATAVKEGEAATIALIERTLRGTGASPVTSEHRRRGTGSDLRNVDLAVWLDELEGNLGNPIVIEVKRRVSTKSLPITVRQIQKYLTDTGASAGLIVYLEEAQNLQGYEILRFAGRRVQWVSATTLFREWRSKGLADILRSRVRGSSA